MGKYDMSVSKWYGNAVRVPRMGTRTFPQFVASSFGIVKSILREELEQEIKIRFTGEDTASADIKNSTINISSDFLRGEIGDETLNTDSTVACLIGVIVHEAAHFAYTPENALLTAADYVKARSKCTFSLPFAATLMNVVEDIYIEAEIDRVIPNLSWTLEILNSVMFKDEVFIRTFEEFEKITEASRKISVAGRIMSALIYAKTRKYVESSDYIESLFNTALLARNLDRFEDRLDLTLALYNQLMVNVPKVEEEEGGKGTPDTAGECEEGEGGTGASDASDDEEKEEGKEGSESKPTSLGDLSRKDANQLKRMLREIDRVLASHDEDRSLPPRRSGYGTQGEQIERKLEEFEAAEAFELDLSFDEDSAGISEGTDLYMFHKVELDAPLEVDPRYGALAEIARQRAVVNRPYGLDRTRGHSIRKLYRIATDQKIFAENAKSHSYRPMQVIILVDYSGSMTVARRSLGKEYDETNLVKASRAALGAAIALTEAQCDVAVYAHTAQLTSQTSVDLYTVKEFNTPLSKVAEKFGWLVRYSRPYQNRDGYAIYRVGKNFMSDGRRKLLIVISDGEPAAHGYSGPQADAHTKRKVDELREQGVDVLSISITPNAKYANDRIYGERNNVYNEDPNVIAEIVDRIIQKGV